MLVKSAKEYVRKKSSSYTAVVSWVLRAVQWTYSALPLRLNSKKVLGKSANLFHKINATRHSQISLDAINAVVDVLMMEDALVDAARMDDDAVTNPTEKKVHIDNLKKAISSKYVGLR